MKFNFGKTPIDGYISVSPSDKYTDEKGYGFIEGEHDEDIFVHYSAIKQDGYKSLSEGQMVEYELLETEKGLQAINVKEVSNATVR